MFHCLNLVSEIMQSLVWLHAKSMPPKGLQMCQFLKFRNNLQKYF